MRTLLFAVATASLASACVDMSEPDTGTKEAYVESRNRLAANRLAANRLAANRLAANRLAANSLSSTRLSALEETSEILETAGGREVYAYMMSCALGPGTTIEKDGVYDSETGQLAEDDYCDAGFCSFGGNLGLADDWTTRKLSHAGEGWVSACLFARINFHETAEDISLRGRHPGLSISNSERSQYTIQEGAFFGNVFTNGDAIDWNACMGDDQAAVSPDPDTGGGLNLRDCSEPDGSGLTMCGFGYSGLCAGSANERASCSSIDPLDGYYSDCRDVELTERSKGRYRQVITVYVTN